MLLSTEKRPPKMNNLKLKDISFLTLETPERFFLAVRDLLGRTDSASFQNMEEWHNYIKVTHKPDYNFSTCLVGANGENLAYFFVLGYKEKNSNDVSLCLTQKPTGLPEPIFNRILSQKQRRRICKLFLAFLSERISSKRLNIIRFLYDVSSLDAINHDVFASSWIDATKKAPLLRLESVVDLKKSEAELWLDLRRSFKSIINNGLREFSFKTFDQSTINQTHLELHQELHYKSAARRTRSSESFFCMHNFVRNGKGLFHIQYKDGKPVQSLYTIFGVNCAYSGSLATDKSIDITTPPTHSLNWMMLKELRNRNIRFYHSRCTSTWLIPSDYDHLTTESERDKALNLSLFKGGLGGKKMPFIQIDLCELLQSD